MTLPQDAQRVLASRFAQAGLDSPALDARLLVQQVTGLASSAILTSLVPLNTSQSEALEALAARRLAREPMARLLGEREFFGLPFQLNDDCLIPRPDSETLIEAALDLTADTGRALDLGTGPGTLLLAFLANKPGWTGRGIDLSTQAIAAASANADSLGLGERASFAQGSWFDGAMEQFDLILTNPPYIPSPDCETLQEEVRRFDPRLALDGGQDGFDAYRAIIAAAPAYLSSEGILIVEAGIGQADGIAALGLSAGLRHHSTRADLAGVPRAVILTAG